VGGSGVVFHSRDEARASCSSDEGEPKDGGESFGEKQKINPTWEVRRKENMSILVTYIWLIIWVTVIALILFPLLAWLTKNFYITWLVTSAVVIWFILANI
jgi:uncharacterized membrane protein